MFPSLHSDGVKRQICIGDIVVTLRPRFTKISFSLRLPLGTFLARVFAKRSKSADIISRHFLEILTLRPQNDISVSALLGKNIRKGNVLPFICQILLRVAWLALERSQRYASASHFLQKQKPWTEDTGMEGLLFLPLLEQ